MNSQNHSYPDLTWCRQDQTKDNLSLYPQGFKASWNTGQLEAIHACSVRFGHGTELEDGYVASVLIGLRSIKRGSDVVIGSIAAVVTDPQRKKVSQLECESYTSWLNYGQGDRRTRKTCRQMWGLTNEGRSPLAKYDHLCLALIAGWTNTIRDHGLDLHQGLHPAVWEGVLRTGPMCGDWFAQACADNPVRPYRREEILASMRARSECDDVTFSRFLKKQTAVEVLNFDDSFIAHEREALPIGDDGDMSMFYTLFPAGPGRVNLGSYDKDYRAIISRINQLCSKTGVTEDELWFDEDPSGGFSMQPTLGCSLSLDGAALLFYRREVLPWITATESYSAYDYGPRGAITRVHFSLTSRKLRRVVPGLDYRKGGPFLRTKLLSFGTQRLLRYYPHG